MDLVKEAYRKYRGRSKGAERVIVASYESLMKFKESYLLGIFDQLNIKSKYLTELKNGDTTYPLNFKDDNSKYIRTPPAQKKSTTAVQRPAKVSSGGVGGIFGSIMRQHQQEGGREVQHNSPLSKEEYSTLRLGAHQKISGENVRL